MTSTISRGSRTADTDVLLTEADISHARELVSYEPRVRIEEGLRRTVDSFRASAAVGVPSSA